MHTTFLTPAILEEAHTAADYLQWAQSLITQVKAEPDGLSRIRLRIGLVKELMNEAFPIALLAAKYFDKSPQVSISLKIGSQSFDAVVSDKRSEGSSVQYIEVTMAYEGEDDYLRMLTLHKVGEVSGLGTVTKHGTKKTKLAINVENEMVSQAEILRRERDCISQAIERKLGISYPPNTLLLIGFDDTMSFNRNDNIRNLEAILSDYSPKLMAFHSVVIVGVQKDLFICKQLA